MKKLILAAVIGLFTVSALASGIEHAPKAVKASFTKLYPNVTEVNWDKEGADFEATFEVNKVETTCLFDASGKLLETETEIAVSALPKGVADYVAKHYAGQKIREASVIVDDKKVTTYEAEINEYDLVFDANGNFLKKVSAFASGGDYAPPAVKASFTKLYPKVTKVKWGKEEAKFEAEFELNKFETSCLFDASGNLLETETEIAISALPKGVADYVAKNYAGQKIEEASEIVDAKKVKTYDIEVKDDVLIFDASGNFLQKKENS